MADFEWNMETAKRVWREECMEEGIEKGTQSTLVSAIKNIMQGFDVTAEKAMEVLKIPKSDWGKYMSML